PPTRRVSKAPVASSSSTMCPAGWSSPENWAPNRSTSTTATPSTRSPMPWATTAQTAASTPSGTRPQSPAERNSLPRCSTSWSARCDTPAASESSASICPPIREPRTNTRPRANSWSGSAGSSRRDRRWAPGRPMPSATPTDCATSSSPDAPNRDSSSPRSCRSPTPRTPLLDSTDAKKATRRWCCTPAATEPSQPLRAALGGSAHRRLPRRGLGIAAELGGIDEGALLGLERTHVRLGDLGQLVGHGRFGGCGRLGARGDDRFGRLQVPSPPMTGGPTGHRHRGPADAHPGDVVEDVMPAEVERGQNGHAEEDPGARAEESTLVRAHHEQGGGEGHGDV